MIKFNDNRYKYGVFSADGLLWVKTLTRAKANNYAESILKDRGVVCDVKSLTKGDR